MWLVLQTVPSLAFVLRTSSSRCSNPRLASNSYPPYPTNQWNTPPFTGPSSNQPFVLNFSKKSTDNTELENKKEKTFSKTNLLPPVSSSTLLEMRLDATLLSIYTLCRYLIYDLTTGIKQVPGWQLQDWIGLAQVTSSCIVGSLIWISVGYTMGIFQEGNEQEWWDVGLRVGGTALLVGPLWVGVEIWNHWPPNGAVMGSFQGEWAGGDFWQGVAEAIGTGTVGLALIMVVGKTVASDARY